MLSRLRQIAAGVRYVWLVVGLTLLVFCAVEATATVVLRVYTRATQPRGDTRLQADAYGNAPWVADYYREFHDSRNVMRWTPYVYWRRQPRTSPLISVDERGLRKTISSDAPGAVKIFLFGGSTMWGTGARDAYTIPSLLARELERHGVTATVTNYGETGWVTTQELIALEIELQQGRRPDLVIFYDGINDTYTAFQQAVAGIPQNEFNRVREFNFMTKSVKERLRLIARDAALNLSIRKLFHAFTPTGRKGIGVELDEAAPGAALDADQSKRLAGQVIDVYRSNIELVRALGEHYEFKSLFYWQPTISDKPVLTAYERECRAEMVPVDRFFQHTYQVLRDRRLDQEGPGRVRDLVSLFETTAEPMFVDRFHLGEAGNEMVARRMLPDVLAELGVADGGTPRGAAGAAIR